MRKRYSLQILAATGISAISIALLLMDGERIRFRGLYPEVAKCKTIAEAESVMGRPPGRYVTTDVGYMSPSGYKAHGPGPDGRLYADDLAYWAGDDCCIFVVHYSDGTIKGVQLESPIGGLPWREKIRDFLRRLVE